MIKLLLVAFAVAVMLCIAINVINGPYTLRWEAGAFAAFFAASLPFGDVAIPTNKPSS